MIERRPLKWPLFGFQERAEQKVDILTGDLVMLTGYTHNGPALFAKALQIFNDEIPIVITDLGVTTLPWMKRELLDLLQNFKDIAMSRKGAVVLCNIVVEKELGSTQESTHVSSHADLWLNINCNHSITRAVPGTKFEVQVMKNRRGPSGFTVGIKLL